MQISSVVLRMPFPQSRRASLISALAVRDRQPDGVIRLSLDNNGVISGIFELRGKLSAHVARSHERLGRAGRPERGDGRPPVAGGAGACKRPDGKDDPVFRIIRTCARRDLVPHHLVADTRAAQVIFIFFDGVLGPHASRRQIDMENLSGPPSIAGHDQNFLSSASSPA